MTYNEHVIVPILDHDVTERIIAAGMRSGASLVEIFLEDRRSSSASLDDGRIEEIHSGRDCGAGIRVIVGDATGFAHTSDLSEAGLGRAVAAGCARARDAKGAMPAAHTLDDAQPALDRMYIETYPETVAKAAKVALLVRANDAARSAGREIAQVSCAYSDSHRRIQIANSDGLHVLDDQVRTGFVVSCVANRNGDMQSAFSTLRHTMGFELFDQWEVEAVAQEAARVALLKLDAQPAPSGPMPVVLKSGAGGVLFHEACGHGLEADAIAKGASVFAGRIGEQVASPLVTLVDDGTLAGEWGASAIDDEGHATGANTLIENGQLTNYMWDYLRATKEGSSQTGNGRRQSYHYMPMVRMTNTFVQPGETDATDIIDRTARGIYVVGLAGGSVNTATGDFVFSITEAYELEHGRIGAPLRDALLIGNGPEVLKNIDVIGNDFAFGWGGTCGKNGQGVPVGQGQPTLRVATGLSIGGTAA